MGSVDTIINIIEETRDHIIVTLPIFIPDARDCEYDQGEKPLTAEQIRKFAEEYLDWKIVDLEHEFLYNGQVIGTLMESHITTRPQIVKFIDGTPREYPIGTWFVTLKITDQDVIQGIKDGHYTGGSATTIERKDAEKLRKLLNSHVPASTKSRIKRIKISDIKDPVVITISIVHSPCVPLAKFCSLKNNNKKVSNMTKELNEQIEEETKGFIAKIGEILGSTKSDKEKDDEKDDGSKKQPDFVTAADFDDFKSEIIELVTAMNDKVNEVVKASAKADDEEDEEDEPLGLTPEEEKELERLLAKKEASTKSDDVDDEEEEEEEEDEDDKEEDIKASSKSTPVHDTGKKSKPQLTDSAIVYSIMGRDNTGSAKRK